jgi:hypothetical protein
MPNIPEIKGIFPMNRLIQSLGVALLVLTTLTTFSCRPLEQGSSGSKDDRSAGQSNSITGVVSDPLGVAVANAPIQAANKRTGATVQTSSSISGRFALSNLEPGTYEVSLTMPCCAFKPFVKDDVNVEGAAQSVELDIRLQQDGDFATTGLADDPGILAAAVRKRIPSAGVRPTPKTSDGRPDLSGVWLVSDDPYPQQPLPLPHAAALAKQRDDGLWKDHPHARCLPWGMPVPFGVGPALAKFVQTSSLVVILFEDTPGFRQFSWTAVTILRTRIRVGWVTLSVDGTETSSLSIRSVITITLG